jgi:ribonuclease HI
MGKESKKYYAVRIGRKPGIYYSWPECKSQIQNFPGAIYKSFRNLSDAKEFIKITEKKSINNSSYAYVDGSFNIFTKYYGYGGFIMHNNQKYIIQGKGNAPNLVEMRNVAGEIIGCQEACKKAIQLGIRDIDIFYDYAGIKEWATGSWDRKKEETKQYYYFMQSIKPILNINFRKVEGHSGNEGNDEADRLAKEAVGINVNSQNNIINNDDKDNNEDINDKDDNDNDNDNKDNNADNDDDNEDDDDNDDDDELKNLDKKNKISNSPLKFKRSRKNMRRNQKLVINNYKSLKDKKIDLSIIKENCFKSKIIKIDNLVEQKNDDIKK